MATLSTTTRASAQPALKRAAVRITHRQWLALILVVHGLLAFWYSVVIPPWEAHDEWAHYRHAAYIAEELALPDPNQRLTSEFEFDEANQPPLYYVLTAVPMLAVDTQDGYRPVANPYATRGTGEGGVNFALHDPAAEAWPWSGTLLALHLGRLVSVLISTLALLATYAVVRILAPGLTAVALVATGLQALAPQYVFLSAVMTNDILLIALETTLLYLCLRLVRDGITLRRAALIGVVAALSLLTKYLALALLPVVVVSFVLAVWVHRREPGATRRAGFGVLALLLSLGVLGGLWLARNAVLTGMLLPRDPYSIRALQTGIGDGAGLQLDWAAIPPALLYGFKTYWVSFGWGNVGAPNWVYTVWLLIAIGGLIGVVVWLRRETWRQMWPLIVVVGIFVAAVVALPLLRELLHESSFLRGRYVLSTLPVAAWVISLGWQQLSGRGWRWLQWALLAWPAALTIALVPLLLMPAYAAPSQQLPASQSASAIPLDVRFGDAARLLSAEVWPNDTVAPGEGLAVTLTWQVLARTDEPYTLAVSLLGAGGQSYGGITSYPGHGNAATTVWNPGDTFSETYWFPITEAGPTPALGRIAVALFRDAEEGGQLPVFDSTGAAMGDHLQFSDLRIRRAAEEETAGAADLAEASFGDIALLSDVRYPALSQRPGWAVPILIRWQALRAVTEPFKVSVQLLDRDGNWVAGSDGEISPDLPPSLWHRGDQVTTTRWVELPADLAPGDYTIAIALYHPDTLARIPALDKTGQPLPADAFIGGKLTVAP